MACTLETTGKKFSKPHVHVGPAQVSPAYLEGQVGAALPSSATQK